MAVNRQKVATRILEPKKRPFYYLVLATFTNAALAVAVIWASVLIWEGYKDYHQKQLLLNILPGTEWVKEKASIYVVNYKQLVRINLDGTGTEKIYDAKRPITDALFSPDGKKLLVFFPDELIVYQLYPKAKELFSEKLDIPVQKDVRGSFNDFVWNRQSDKFFYRISRWSAVSSQNQAYVFDLATNKKSLLLGFPPNVSEIVWDWEGTGLVFAKKIETSAYYREGKVKLFRVALDNSVAQEIGEVSAPAAELAKLDLSQSTVKLFLGTPDQRFKKYRAFGLVATASDGRTVAGLDERNYVYLLDEEKKKQRMVELPRVSRDNSKSLYHVEWSPGRQNLVLFHRSQGILVLDIKSQQIGRLIHMEADGLAWPRP